MNSRESSRTPGCPGIVGLKVPEPPSRLPKTYRARRTLARRRPEKATTLLWGIECTAYRVPEQPSRAATDFPSRHTCTRSRPKEEVHSSGTLNTDAH
eukprot:4931160-Alexandrium_andersonii.AAC.1